MSSKRNLFVRLVPCRCLRGEEETVTTLDYSHCSLEQVPKEIFSFEKTLEELYLDANQIEELPKQLFNCQSLNRLSLPDNDLTALPASIANLINLRELDVSKNSIQEFPENIKNCKVLAIVEASVNPISKLPEGFTQLLSLTQLYLNDAFLEFLPGNFGRLAKLQILELRENQLKMLPKSMHKLTQLERLDLGSNEFTEVPEVLEQLTALKELWIDGNRLTFLPGIIGMLKQLTYLDVSKNNIEMVDDQLAGCENLQDLLLSNNALTQLPGSIGSLKKLTALKVDENQLMYLPDSIGGLTALDELDCSFNEIEALPPSIGQCTNMRTFAADHNFLAQLPVEVGNWRNATVLFLHSNKLEYLPEEMGDMQRLKVINLSDNKLKNLPFSFTKLSQLTAMWLSENQSKPLIPLQKEEDPELHKTVLTNYMFPQQPRSEDYIPNSDNESFNPSLWEEQRKQRAQVAFECDEDKDERETPPREGNLKRYPTPYPDELKNMVKTAHTIAHRLREDESSDESGKDAKPGEDTAVAVRDVGVKASDSSFANGKAVEMDPKVTVNCVQRPSDLESRDTTDTMQTMELKDSDSSRVTVNHEDTLEDSEDISSDEEMKVAEMRPPLIEISINQPKVVALSKDKKADESKDADSLLDETAANSNQNNSNCSSPSRMSDSVSLTTDSSQDTSLCTPEKEAKVMIISKIRQEDENLNELQETSPLLQNGNGSDSSLQAMLKTQQENEAQHEGLKANDFVFSVEEKLALIERGMDIKNGMEDSYRWDQINMNVSKLPPDNVLRLEDLDKAKTRNQPPQDVANKSVFNNNTQPEPLENGNQALKPAAVEQLSRRVEEQPTSPAKFEIVRTATVGVTASSEMPMSRSTEELSPQRLGPAGPVGKSQSVTNIETGAMKIYSIVGDNGPYESSCVASRAPLPSAQGQNIVRSKSASLLNDQPLQVYPGSSASSSDLLSGSKTLSKYEAGYGHPAPPAGRIPVPAGMHGPGVPQYNIQYSSSTMPKDSLWTQRTAVPPEQGYLPSQRLQRSDSHDSYAKPPTPTAAANTNYSNRNNAQGYGGPQRGGGPAVPMEMWAAPPPKDRLLPAGPRGTLQRQGSNSSAVSMSLADPRRLQVAEGEYMTYRDIHTLGRGPPMGPGMQRPLSARTYSIDGPNVPRPQSARPSAHEVPERTMSVSDFNYSRTSPSKRPNMRVKSEHSLLDAPGTGRVPPDWRDQVLRHIEAKKMEKDEVFGTPQNYSVDTLRKVPLTNGQMCPPSRAQMNCGQVHCPPPPAPVARHPSREQLIDYLMLKVSQPQGPSRPPLEVLQQEIRVKIEKNPELGFSISGGIGGRGNPFRPEDNGIFVTRVQPEGPAAKLLQPGDKIVQANGYNFVNIDHGQAVSLLKTFPSTVDLFIVRELSA
ncbi:erbin isoform X2 [Amia ocellicauda]|uniref:erbin isoform X2 n=1 Tax=Amia ocellicauda TaxID=2972642 RepID=UPI0034643D80